MSESFVVKMQTAPLFGTRNGAADLRMLAEVEKWMAAIREINREREGLPNFRR
jgi:hypothetical protein